MITKGQGFSRGLPVESTVSRRALCIALAILTIASAILPALPVAEAHPYHLHDSYEVLVNPDPVDLNSWIAMSFVATGSYYVSRLSLYVQDDAPAGDALFVSVRADASGSPSAGNLTQGFAVANSTASWVNFDMNPWVPLVGGTRYWIVAESLGPANGGSSYWNSGTDLLGKGLTSSDGASWLSALTNYNYRVYGFVQPSWSFSVSQSTGSLVASQPVVFRANFTNAGPGDAEALWVNVSLSPSLAYVSDDAAAIGGVRSGQYTFSFTNIVPGSYSFNVTASAVRGTADGTVTSTSVTFDGTDHNGVPLSLVTRTLAVTIHAPRLTLSLTSSAPSANPGDSITLNATATNIGSAAASSVLFEGTVDPNATFVSASAFASYTPATRTVSGTIANLGVGAQASIEWTVQVPPGTPDGADVRSDARATARDASATALTTETALSVSTVRAPRFAPALLLDRSSVERGDQVVATWYFNNTGSVASPLADANWTLGGDFALVSLTPNMPYNASASGFDVVWLNLGVGPHMLVARLRVTRGLADGVQLPIQVRWSATDGNGNALPPATRSGSVILRAPAPTVLLAPSTLRAEAGSSFVVDLTLRNLGGAAAIGWLNLTLPAGVEYVDDNGTYPSSVAGNQVSWSVPLLAAGSGTIMGVRLRAAGAPGTASLRFTIAYTDGKGGPVASIVSNPAAVEIVPAPVETPVLLWDGVVGAVGVAALAIFLVFRRRKGTLTIDDAFVVDKGGILLAHRSASFIQYQDEDILVGMFKAVQDFVKDSFSRGTDEHMKGLEFGERKILIERGPHHFVAVVYRGTESAALRERVQKLTQEIEEKYGETLAHWGGSLDEVRGITILLPMVWGGNT